MSAEALKLVTGGWAEARIASANVRKHGSDSHAKVRSELDRRHRARLHADLMGHRLQEMPCQSHHHSFSGNAMLNFCFDLDYPSLCLDELEEKETSYR